MIGAIAGDIVGSVHEGGRPQAKDAFPLFVPASTFTDDTVLTVAVASVLRQGGDYASALRQWGRRYPHAGYGGWFYDWLFDDQAGPYNSFGNGSAMRVSAVGWAFSSLEGVLAEARRSALVTHNHPEGVKGAQAVAAVVFYARRGESKEAIRALLRHRFGYACEFTVDELRTQGGFDITCQGTVPAAAAAFLEAIDFEDALRNAVSLGGDADTLACITGAIAEAFYGGVPEAIEREVMARLDEALRNELIAFARTFGIPLANRGHPDFSQ